MHASPDEVPCLYFCCRDDGIVAYANTTFCDRMGYSRGELEGMRQDKLFTLATRIFQQTHLFPLLKIQGSAEEIFLTLVSKSGEELPVLINAQRSEDEGLTRYSGMIVHNRKKYEDEILTARKTLEEAVRENKELNSLKKELQERTAQLDQQLHQIVRQNEELRQFNRILTHDLQEPLRKLSIFTNLLQDPERAGEREKLIGKFQQIYAQMRAIVSGLQQYVWLTDTPLALSELKLQDVLTGVVEELKVEYPGVELVVEEEGGDLMQADRGQIHLLLRELLSNAIRFRKETDRVCVQITSVLIKRNRLKYLGERYQYSDFIRIRVRDLGMGFDASYKDKVFELFKRLHPQSGRGIGLSLCRKVVENHGGSISIESEVGVGTTVSLLLPLEAAARQENDFTQKEGVSS